MPNTRKQISDYKRLAEQRGLKFVSSTAPYRVRESCDWECLRCHRIIHTSFSNLQIADHGCMCQIGAVNNEQKYRDLANRLSIVWVGKKLPVNVKEITRWYSNVTRTEFDAAYADIGYRSIKTKFRKYVAVVEETNGEITESA